ncbi:MAG: dioxygenase [Gammaproteobacteria bacterium]|jgi:chlorocatechol 1,2-dioxygenase|nr:dioxygenase [Gammaproteobacteria bacterium]
MSGLEKQQRAQTIVGDIINAIRDVLRKHDVTFNEYRAGFMHLIGLAKAGEVPLVLDCFLNQTICDIEMKTRQGSRSNVEGPYFLDDAPMVTDAIKVRGDTLPLLIRCQVKDLQGQPIPDVITDIWFADSNGDYSGYSEDFPKDYFRGKVTTDSDGKYAVMGSIPKEYPMAQDEDGPTGKIIELLGGQIMRPQHVHFKYLKEGYAPLTTQSYFEGEKYLNEDPVGGVFEDLTHQLKEENGVAVLDLDVVLDPAE